jgi:hypothetical protein
MYRSESIGAGDGSENEPEGWSRSACIWRVQLQHERHPPSSDLWACSEGSGPVARLLCKCASLQWLPPILSTEGNSYRAPRRLKGPHSRFTFGSSANARTRDR